MNGDHGGPDLGAYVLGILDPGQAGEVERHLEGCAACRQEREGLQEMADVLGGMPPEVFLDGPPDGGDLLLARTVRQVHRETAVRRRNRVLGAAAAAVLAVAVAAGGGILIGQAMGPAASSVRAAGTVQVEAVGASGARLRGAVSPAADWVRLDVAVSGVARGEHCKLVVVRKDGRREIAGSWTVGDRGETGGITIDGAADVPIAEVAAVNVEGTDGRVYVSALT